MASKPKFKGKYLDIKWRIWTKENETGQTWALEPSGHLKNGNGYYLAMPGDTKDQGKAPVVWDKSGERGQLWTFE